MRIYWFYHKPVIFITTAQIFRFLRISIDPMQYYGSENVDNPFNKVLIGKNFFFRIFENIIYEGIFS